MRVEDVFIPAHRAVPYDFKGHEWGDTGTVGYRLHGNPMYLGRSLVYFYSALVCTQVGAAWAALDEWEVLLERGTSFPPRIPRTESPEYQLWYGRLLSLVETSTTILFGALDQQADVNGFWAEGGPEYSVAQDARVRGIILKAGELSGEAVMLAIQTAGTELLERASREGMAEVRRLVFDALTPQQQDALAEISLALLHHWDPEDPHPWLR